MLVVVCAASLSLPLESGDESWNTYSPRDSSLSVMCTSHGYCSRAVFISLKIPDCAASIWGRQLIISCSRACTGKPPPDPLGGDHSIRPLQRARGVGEEGPAQPWHPQRSTSINMENWSSLVAGLLWWGGREGRTILTDHWPPMMWSSVVHGYK